MPLQFPWTFSGLNIFVSQCSIDSVGLAVRYKILSNDTEQLFIKTATITIHNSSFGSLNLNTGTKAQITESHIDGKLKDRHTLITGNNSRVWIQNCHFGNFINYNSSTIMFGHNSHVKVENSHFIEHNSSKGVIFLHNNSSLCISGSTFSHNVATFLDYSAISLHDKVHLVVCDTVFKNNSAINGGALNVYKLCHVTLVNCTFFSNSAITGNTLNNSKNSILQMTARTFDQKDIETFAAIKYTFFNQTLSKAIADDQVHFRGTHNIFIKDFAEQRDDLPGAGGAISVALQSQFHVRNCVFDNNSAETIAGAIDVFHSVTVNIEETTFVRNNALQGGVIDIQKQVHLSVTKCTFETNSAQYIAGAICAVLNSIVDIQGTSFVGNIALGDGGAIDVQQQVHISVTSCTFETNSAQSVAGAIYASVNSKVYMANTTFVSNKALIRGGTIEVENSYLSIINCAFKDNSAQNVSGAILAVNNTTLDVQETTFVGNTALRGGAICVQQEAQLVITNCVFKDNSAQYASGAIDASFNVN